MKSVELSLTVLTPAFVSTADQNCAELGPQTIKGVLRWWWRALPENADLPVDQLKQREAAIFGFASKEISIRSTLGIIFKSQNVPFRDQGTTPYTSGIEVGSRKFKMDALKYLAYGPVATVGKKEKDQSERAFNPKFNDQTGKAKRGLLLKRPAVEPNSTFSLKLFWPDGSLSSTQEKGLVRALAAWLMWGGIGSRSRKGWGSVACERLIADDQLKKAFHAAANDFRSFGKNQGPLLSPTSWPSLKSFRVIFSVTGSSWEEVLGNLGKKYKDLRPSPANRAHWICGSANPRRASSVILKVRRTEQKSHNFEGLIGVFICKRSADNPANDDWKNFLTSLRLT